MIKCDRRGKPVEVSSQFCAHCYDSAQRGANIVNNPVAHLEPCKDCPKGKRAKRRMASLN